MFHLQRNKGNKQTIILLTILFSTIAVAAPRPWQKRIGKEVEVHHKRQHQRVHAAMWPKEPDSPTQIDKAQFAAALQHLCGEERVFDKRADNFSDYILTYAEQFNVDPFLIGGLIFDQSRCLPKTPGYETKYGLSRIDVHMHAPHIRQKKYKYSIFEHNEWTPHYLEVPDYPFNKYKAANPKTNIYWTAAFLRVFKEQMPSLKQQFGRIEYRHYVSHFFYGDIVWNTEPEDRVLTARRRFLHYYNKKGVIPAGEYNGLPLVSPLDGTPRIILDRFGRRRGTKKNGYRHMGLDFVSERDEPLRAMAAGKVVFSGIDLDGAGSRIMLPEETNAYTTSNMGAGGRYVSILHENGLRTLYMHMETVAVEHGQQVKAGDFIGTVGRSGSASSGAHLHLEFRIPPKAKRIDPSPYIQKILVDPDKINAEAAGE